MSISSMLVSTMLDKKFVQKVSKDYETYERAYRALVETANRAQNQAKRAIFAFHRGESKDGAALLKGAAEMLTGLESGFRTMPMLRYEGAYRAAIEEFVEATLLAQFLVDKPLGNVAAIKELDSETYLGGLSDLTGELVRFAIDRATHNDVKEVKRAHEALNQVMSFLISLDLTGYLRTKFDQAKQSERKMEQIVYDLSLKR